MSNTKDKNNIVGLKELRNNISKYINMVNEGKSITVIRRSSPVFIMSSAHDNDSMWEQVIDFTKINKTGVSAGRILSILKKLNEQDRKISKKTI